MEDSRRFKKGDLVWSGCALGIVLGNYRAYIRILWITAKFTCWYSHDRPNWLLRAEVRRGKFVKGEQL